MKKALRLAMDPSPAERPTISTTLGALANAVPALQKLCDRDVSAKSFYHLKKLVNLVTSEVAHFTTQRDALIKELGIATTAGNYELKPDNPHWPTFVAKMTELSEIPIHIAWSPVTRQMLGDAPFSVNAALALGPLFADDDIQADTPSKTGV